jgi:hypothetical protein
MKAVRDKIKDHQCPYCSYVTSENGSTTWDVKAVHYKLRDHTCSQCDYTKSTKQKVNDHIKAVHARDHKCSQCDYAASTGAQIRNHIKSVHDLIRDPKCPHCSHCNIFNKQSNPTHQSSAWQNQRPQMFSMWLCVVYKGYITYTH